MFPPPYRQSLFSSTHIPTQTTLQHQSIPLVKLPVPTSYLLLATPTTTTMALTRSTAPLIWLDLEMTGLNPVSDTILSLSCFITDSNLTLLDPTGYDAVIHHSSAQLGSMDEWCVTQHGKSGLTQRCLASTTTADVAAEGLLRYVKRFVTAKGGRVVSRE